jgi:hypothetical protein
MIYLPIEKDLIPYQFLIDIADEEFLFDVNYNERFDFFTIDVYKDDEPIVLGEKVVYGRALFSTSPNEDKLPQYPITPFDEAGEETRVGWDNFGVSVFLFIGDPNE